MDITIRELTALDLSEGFLETLAGLADVTLSQEKALEVLHKRSHIGIRTFVAVDGQRVVGTVSLIVEQKFIRGGASCGHIEDVVIHPDYMNRGLGGTLVRHAVAEAGKLSCYKVILNCYEDLTPFYERCGFKRHDVGMRTNLPRA